MNLLCWEGVVDMGNNPYSILMVMGYLFFQVYAVFYIMVLLDMTGTCR